MTDNSFAKNALDLREREREREEEEDNKEEDKEEDQQDKECAARRHRSLRVGAWES